MSLQFNFLDAARGEHQTEPNVLEGFRYQSELIDPSKEDALVASIRELPFREFDFHGFKGKRRVVSFGWQYEFSGGGRLRKADDIPEFLLALRAQYPASRLVTILNHLPQHARRVRAADFRGCTQI